MSTFFPFDTVDTVRQETKDEVSSFLFLDDTINRAPHVIYNMYQSEGKSDTNV